MKQHTSAEIRSIMTEMPIEKVEALQAAHPQHGITEREARWWGYLMFAKTGAYEGETFVIPVPSTGEEVVQRFLPYVLADRAGDVRVGLVRRAWPDSGFDRAG